MLFDLVDALDGAIAGLPGRDGDLGESARQCRQMLQGLLDKKMHLEKETSLTKLREFAAKADQKSPLHTLLTVIDLLEWVRGEVEQAVTAGANLEKEEKSSPSEKGEKEEKQALPVEDWRDFEQRRREAKQETGGPKKASAKMPGVANVAAPDPDGATEDVDDPAVPGNVDFPHDSKHQPPPKLENYNESTVLTTLEVETGKPKAVALYKTSKAKRVVQWENRARRYGLLLHDNFTIIHQFDFIVGADQGDRTRCIRIDGDHGHPIHPNSGLVNFHGYVVGEFEFVATLPPEARQAALQRLVAYLKRIKVDPAPYLLLVPKEPKQRKDGSKDV